jgi:L-rhamnose mutarotase
MHLSVKRIRRESMRSYQELQREAHKELAAVIRDQGILNQTAHQFSALLGS